MPAFANDYQDLHLDMILIAWRRLVGGGLTDAGIHITAQGARDFNVEIPDEVLVHVRMKRSRLADSLGYGSDLSSSSSPANYTTSSPPLSQSLSVSWTML